MKKNLALFLTLMLVLPFVCALAETAEPSQGQSAAVVGAEEPVPFASYQQAPMLDDVEGLPPVEERLPVRPKVYNSLTPDHVDLSIGQYGGTLRTVSANAGWNPHTFALNNEPLFNTPNITGEEITPNILERYEMSADQKVFTFTIREGLRWSDGVPVTTEDVDFTFNDFWLNEEINATLPAWYTSSSGTPLTLTIIDDLTFQLAFDEPNGGFLITNAIQNWVGYPQMIKPKHYLMQFMPQYADPAELAAKCEEFSVTVEDWVVMFFQVAVDNWSCNSPQAIGFPTLAPWMLVSSNESMNVFERNPYYFKVDVHGNQLPYIDRITTEFVQDTESLTLKLISGEVDYNFFETALVNMPLYLQNAERNGFKVVMSEAHLTPTDIYFNLYHPDEKVREIIGDKRFRSAVNYAFNSAEVIDIVYLGFASPAVLNEDVYDLELAGALLDDVGLPMGADGYRTYSDGTPFVLNFEYADRAPDMKMVVEMFVSYMADVGIKVNSKVIDLSLWEERFTNYESLPVVIWSEIIWYNLEWNHERIARAYSDWWTTQGEKGIEPPEDLKALFTLSDGMAAQPPSKALTLYDEYMENYRENTWSLQYMGSVQQPIIVNEQLKNCDILSPTWGIGLTFGGEIFYFDE